MKEKKFIKIKTIKINMMADFNNFNRDKSESESSDRSYIQVQY